MGAEIDRLDIAIETQASEMDLLEKIEELWEREDIDHEEE